MKLYLENNNIRAEYKEKAEQTGLDNKQVSKEQVKFI